MIQIQVLNKILTEGFEKWAINYELSKDYFSDFQDEYDYLYDYYEKYKITPDTLTFLNKFPNFDIINVYESDNSLIDNLKNDYILRQYASIYNTDRDKVINAPYESVVNIINELQKVIDETAPSNYTGWLDLRDKGYQVAREALDDIDSVCYPIGLDGLEELHGLNKNTDYLIIAGRPNHGKSMFLCKIIATLLKNDKTVAFYSGEMEKSEVIFRIYSILTGRSTSELMYGKSQQALDDFVAYMEQNQFKLYMADKRDFGNKCPTANQLRTFCIKTKAEVLAVDQVSLMSPNQRAKYDWRDTAAISRELKMLRDDLNIPILVVSQLNRTKTEDGDTDVVQLAGSDVLGQDATKVLTIKRDKSSNITTLSVAKNRSGKAFVNVKYDIDYDHGQFRRPEEVEVITEVKGEVNLF